jgi:hypothetical protein
MMRAAAERAIEGPATNQPQRVLIPESSRARNGRRVEKDEGIARRGLDQFHILCTFGLWRYGNARRDGHFTMGRSAEGP